MSAGILPVSSLEKVESDRKGILPGRPPHPNDPCAAISTGRGWRDPRHRIQTSGPLIQAKWVSRERRVESAVISVVPAASATAT